MRNVLRSRPWEWWWTASCVVVAAGSRAALALRPHWAVSPLEDDAFYVLSVSRNIARGMGPSVDGVHLTNGFQPLIAYLYVPLFWLCGGQDWPAVNAVFFLSAGIAGVSVWLAARTVRELAHSWGPSVSGAFLSPAMIVAFLWTFSMAIFMHTTNGLETGLYSLLLLWDILFYLRLRDREDSALGSWLAFGILLGFTVLCRIDAAILTVVLALYEIIFGKKHIAGPLIASGAAFMVSAPWWWFNWSYFGSLMPTSGQAENLWPIARTECLRRAFQAVTDMALTIFYAPDSLPLSMRIVLAIALIAIAYLTLRKAPLRTGSFATPIRILLPFWLFSGVLVVYYTFFFRAPHFIARFLEPMRILWILTVACSVPLIIERYSQRMRVLLTVAIAAATALFFGDRYVCDFLRLDGPNEFYQSGEWARAHPTETVGMLQSGIAGFIAPNVLNLDGKVNTEALHAEQQDTLPSYLRAAHVTYLADWKPFIEDIAVRCAADGLYFDSSGRIGRVQLMKLRP